LHIIAQRKHHSLLPMVNRIGVPNNYISNLGRSEMYADRIHPVVDDSDAPITENDIFL
jgi:hypothetical protein